MRELNTQAKDSYNITSKREKTFEDAPLQQAFHNFEPKTMLIYKSDLVQISRLFSFKAPKL